MTWICHGIIVHKFGWKSYDLNILWYQVTRYHDSDHHDMNVIYRTYVFHMTGIRLRVIESVIMPVPGQWLGYPRNLLVNITHMIIFLEYTRYSPRIILGIPASGWADGDGPCSEPEWESRAADSARVSGLASHLESWQPGQDLAKRYRHACTMYRHVCTCTGM